MITAYVMVKANTGEADRLKNEIGEFDGVSDVRIVAGDVDFIAKLAVDAPSDVKDVAAALQDLEGVEDTQTYVAMD